MGVWEIALIALVVLLVAGPQRLPEIMRTLGGWAGQARNLARGMQSELEREGRQMTEPPPSEPRDASADSTQQTPPGDESPPGESDSGDPPR